MLESVPLAVPNCGNNEAYSNSTGLRWPSPRAVLYNTIYIPSSNTLTAKHLSNKEVLPHEGLCCMTLHWAKS